MSVISGKGNKGLIVTLGILAVVIVGLIVAIVGINIKWGDGKSELVNQAIDDSLAVFEKNGFEISESEKALLVSNSIIEIYEENDDFTIEDARGYYESAIKNATVDEEKNLVLYYAKFIFEYEHDEKGAIAVLKERERLFESESDKLNYCASLRTYYNSLGDSATASFCDEKINEITRMQKDVPGRVDEGEESNE